METTLQQNTASPTLHHRIVSPDEWLIARKQLLKREKELTRSYDQLRTERSELPWTEVTKQYIFDGPDGKETSTRFPYNDIIDGDDLDKDTLLSPGDVVVVPTASLPVKSPDPVTSRLLFGAWLSIPTNPFSALSAIPVTFGMPFATDE